MGGETETVTCAYEHDCPEHGSGASQTGGKVGSCRCCMRNARPSTLASTSWDAAKAGHVECLRRLQHHGFVWDKTACAMAAQEGHLEALTFLHASGCPWGAETCSSASYGGHLPCLEYAHTNGCAWSDDACSTAAFKGNVECLEYALRNGCPAAGGTITSAFEGGRPEIIRCLVDHGVLERNKQHCAVRHWESSLTKTARRRAARRLGLSSDEAFQLSCLTDLDVQ